jgi:hypothetical protein
MQWKIGSSPPTIHPSCCDNGCWFTLAKHNGIHEFMDNHLLSRVSFVNQALGWGHPKCGAVVSGEHCPLLKVVLLGHGIVEMAWGTGAKPTCEFFNMPDCSPLIWFMQRICELSTYGTKMLLGSYLEIMFSFSTFVEKVHVLNWVLSWFVAWI